MYQFQNPNSEHMNAKIISNILFLLFCFGTSIAYATIVAPFRNLLEVAKVADAVVYGKCMQQFDFQEIESTTLSYTIQPIKWLKSSGNSSITVKSLTQSGLDWQKTISGDFQAQVGKNYLLFLMKNTDGTFSPLCLSFYSFHEQTWDDIQYLLPSEEADEIHLMERPDGALVEPLMVYEKEKLLDHLSKCIQKGLTWNSTLAGIYLSLKNFEAKVSPRANPPNHCANLFPTEPWVRWTGFPGSIVKVWYRTGGDANCASAITFTEAAVDELEAKYPGIGLTKNGAFSGYTPNCFNGSAYQGNFTTWVNTNLVGSRHICVIYNDPCEEITDLSGCAGTLAIGGLYTTGSQHSHQGRTWNNAGYAFIVVNDNTGTCYCTAATYGIMMQHEMTHGLGIGHIESNFGAANMNPSCCNGITNLDIDCLEYTYPSSLPVELARFEGYSKDEKFNLQWETLSERDAESFTLEMSQNGVDFQDVTTKKAFGNTSSLQVYSHSMPAQSGKNYFRLKQTDMDKNYRYVGNFILLEGEISNQQELIIVSQNTNTIQFFVSNIKSSDAELSVFDAQGKVVYQSKIVSDSGFSSGIISIARFPAGIYQFHVKSSSESSIARFTLTK